MKTKRENGVLLLHGREISYIWTRKAVKNINLHIKSDGSILVSSPFSVSKTRIERFLSDNEKFIENALSKVEMQKQYQKEPSFTEGSSVFLFGKEKTLHFTKDTDTVTETEDCLILQKNLSAEKAKAKIYAYAETKLQSLIYGFCDKYYPHFQKATPYPEIRFRLLRASYGNCRPKLHVLTFSKRLCCYPTEFIEYIVVHEFTHFLHPDHSKAFYTSVEQLIPDYKQREKYMTALHISPFF